MTSYGKSRSKKKATVGVSIGTIISIVLVVLVSSVVFIEHSSFISVAKNTVDNFLKWLNDLFFAPDKNPSLDSVNALACAINSVYMGEMNEYTCPSSLPGSAISSSMYLADKDNANKINVKQYGNVKVVCEDESYTTYKGGVVETTEDEQSIDLEGSMAIKDMPMESNKNFVCRVKGFRLNQDHLSDRFLWLGMYLDPQEVVYYEKFPEYARKFWEFGSGDSLIYVMGTAAAVDSVFSCTSFLFKSVKETPKMVSKGLKSGYKSIMLSRDGESLFKRAASKVLGKKDYEYSMEGLISKVSGKYSGREQDVLEVLKEIDGVEKSKAKSIIMKRLNYGDEQADELYRIYKDYVEGVKMLSIMDGYVDDLFKSAEFSSSLLKSIPEDDLEKILDNDMLLRRVIERTDFNYEHLVLSKNQYLKNLLISNDARIEGVLDSLGGSKKEILFNAVKNSMKNSGRIVSRNKNIVTFLALSALGEYYLDKKVNNLKSCGHNSLCLSYEDTFAGLNRDIESVPLIKETSDVLVSLEDVEDSLYLAGPCISTLSVSKEREECPNYFGNKKYVGVVVIKGFNNENIDANYKAPKKVFYVSFDALNEYKFFDKLPDLHTSLEHISDVTDLQKIYMDYVTDEGSSIIFLDSLLDVAIKEYDYDGIDKEVLERLKSYKNGVLSSLGGVVDVRSVNYERFRNRYYLFFFEANPEGKKCNYGDNSLGDSYFFTGRDVFYRTKDIYYIKVRSEGNYEDYKDVIEDDFKGYNFCYKEDNVLTKHYDAVSLVATGIASAVGGAVAGYFTGGLGIHLGECLASSSVAGIMAGVKEVVEDNMKWPGGKVYG